MDLPEGFYWPSRTREWWAVWVASPVTESWTPLQWEYLLDTAVVHAAVWGGGDAGPDLKQMGELRQRIERLGGLTPAVPDRKHAPVESGRKRSPLDELASRRSRLAGA